jgi:hypothetical protein
VVFVGVAVTAATQQSPALPKICLLVICLVGLNFEAVNDICYQIREAGQ